MEEGMQLSWHDIPLCDCPAEASHTSGGHIFLSPQGLCGSDEVAHVPVHLCGGCVEEGSKTYLAWLPTPTEPNHGSWGHTFHGLAESGENSLGRRDRDQSWKRWHSLRSLPPIA